MEIPESSTQGTESQPEKQAAKANVEMPVEPPSSLSRLKKLRLPLLALGLIGVVAFFGGQVWLSRAIRKPHWHDAAQKVITFKPGSGRSEIIAVLHRQGILTNQLAAKLWLRFYARNQRFKAGDYEFPSPISPLEVINKLTKGEVATRSFTIPEGYNQWDIARVLASLPGLKQPPLEDPDEALPLLNNTGLIADLDSEAKDLEGYLFPDTYEYTASTTREQLVEIMVKRFRKVYSAELQAKAASFGWNARRVVTMASLIEKEAKVDPERELISSVYHNRLRLGERLACDPTVIYAAMLEGRYRGKIYRSDLERPSPYNTYLLAGLPPGPIASSGRRSLEAALNPAQTDYLYFVVDVTRNDGSHKFSTSSAGHDRAVQLLRQQEREVQSQRPSH